ncbi:hypothetical protein EIP91_003563 [Steccherinum ochraceum]|uniref:Uncharacterized protein n=1 Tax=Steccherinum ochraceum TaxID=92696 RepID=A0A4R0RIT6_9APHY|nr:hypothetical protein EIP91_003563 [Steccherinum ochraceum]
MEHLGPGSDLAPSEIWEIVSMLNLKLKQAREEIQELKELQQTKCEFGQCPAAAEVQKLRTALKQVEEQDTMTPKAPSEDLEDEIMDEDALTRRSRSPASMTVSSQDDHHAHLVPRETLKPKLVKTDLASLPKPTIPDACMHVPVFKSTQGIVSRIPSDVVSLSKCGMIVECHQDILWDASNVHAYLIRPRSLYDPLADGEKWTRDAKVAALQDQTLEVFHRTKTTHTDVYYAGSYQCIEIAELLPEEHAVSPQVFKKFCRETLVDSKDARQEDCLGVKEKKQEKLASKRKYWEDQGATASSSKRARATN